MIPIRIRQRLRRSALLSAIPIRIHRHLRGSALLSAILLAAAPAPAATPDGEVTLRYVASVAGAPVGEATVTVALQDGGYRVTGDARSNNWLQGFTDWRNEFEAAGRVDDGGPAPRRFGYLETDRDKSRHLVIEDGVVRVVKNGRQRPERPAAPFPDVVSALFVAPRCAPDQTVQTGRHVYRLARLAHGPGRCRYVVLEDDDESFEMTLTLGRRDGLIVPTRIVVEAWLKARIELAPETGGGAAAVHGEPESG